MKLNDRFSYFIAISGLTSLIFACSASSSGGGAGGASNSSGGTGSGTGGTSTAHGGSSTGTGNGGTTGNSGGTTSHGGTTSNGGTTASTSGGAANCDPMADPTGMGQDCPAITTCAETACSAEYEECFGADYLNGDFTGGTCADYLTCSVGCDCDSNCETTCLSNADNACNTCMETTIGNCVIANCLAEAFSCAGNGTGGSGSGGAGSGGAAGFPGVDTTKTCADLQACCDAKTGDDKTTCEGIYAAAQGLDIICAAALPAAQCP